MSTPAGIVTGTGGVVEGSCEAREPELSYMLADVRRHGEEAELETRKAIARWRQRNSS